MNRHRQLITVVSGSAAEDDRVTAELIVRAVNHHGALVEIARAFVAHVASYDPLDSGFVQATLKAHASAKDLLASLE
jgi:hypothetical protein